MYSLIGQFWDPTQNKNKITSNGRRQLLIQMKQVLIIMSVWCSLFSYMPLSRICFCWCASVWPNGVRVKQEVFASARHKTLRITGLLERGVCLNACSQKHGWKPGVPVIVQESKLCLCCSSKLSAPSLLLFIVDYRRCYESLSRAQWAQPHDV